MRGKTLVGGTIVKTTFQTCNFHYWPQNNPLLYCVLEILSCNFAGYGINLIRRITLIQFTMKKGKTLTVLVLVVEIASIVVLHAVKISQSEKIASKERCLVAAGPGADFKDRTFFVRSILR